MSKTTLEHYTDTIQLLIEKKQWNRAQELLNDVAQQFPGSAALKALKEKLASLRANYDTELLGQYA